jgi:hypothetical protein
MLLSHTDVLTAMSQIDMRMARVERRIKQGTMQELLTGRTRLV